jgi:hypothetical protein
MLLLWRQARACCKEQGVVRGAKAMSSESRPADSAGRPEARQEQRGCMSRGEWQRRVVATRRE